MEGICDEDNVAEGVVAISNRGTLKCLGRVSAALPEEVTFKRKPEV